MNPVKPGIASTEFWMAMIPQVLTVLVLLGVVNVGDAAMLGDAAGKLVASVVALVASALVIITYIRGRVAVKTAEPPLDR